MKALTVLVIAVSALSAAPALAQDDSNFSGPYVGAYAGYDHVTINEDSTGSSGSKDGVAFGALAGYNMDMGSVVLGIEGEIGDASTRASETDVFISGDEATLSANLDLFLGARLGVKASDKALFYVKGGYTNTKVNLAYDDNAGFAYDESDDLSGFRIGGGVEIAATDRVSFRAEYRYSQYSEYKYQGVATGLDANRHQVLFAAVGRF